MKRVCNAEPDRNVRLVTGVDEMELVMADSRMVRPQPIEHAADLAMSGECHAVCFDRENAVSRKRLENKPDILLVDAAKIAQDEGLEVAHAGFASARSFQTICEVMVSPSSSNLSTKRTPLKAVPSSQVPDRVP